MATPPQPQDNRPPDDPPRCPGCNCDMTGQFRKDGKQRVYCSPACQSRYIPVLPVLRRKARELERDLTLSRYSW